MFQIQLWSHLHKQYYILKEAQLYIQSLSLFGSLRYIHLHWFCSRHHILLSHQVMNCHIPHKTQGHSQYNMSFFQFQFSKFGCTHPLILNFHHRKFQGCWFCYLNRQHITWKCPCKMNFTQFYKLCCTHPHYYDYRRHIVHSWENWHLSFRTFHMIQSLSYLVNKYCKVRSSKKMSIHQC